ncbi:MAG TPA: hypothetical protein VKH65_08460 [Myxococcales bacterium]|nr:hypothetical protein [Myxococcales bacterium]
MRPLAAAVALSLLAAPAFARGRNASKAPRKGADCPRSAVGTMSTDKKGASLRCKADKAGTPRWTRK